MKLTQVEKCWLVALYSDGYKYICRDNSGQLNAFDKMPCLDDYGEWSCSGEFRHQIIPEWLFDESIEDNQILCEITLTDISLDTLRLREVQL